MSCRKGLILHFECGRSGAECSIISNDWGKWLKIGLCLLKIGKLTIDIGIDNPLGLLYSGAETIKEIYDAYRMPHDTDFLTFIKSLLLLPSEQVYIIGIHRDRNLIIYEQDELAQKLRHHACFDKVIIYLLN